MQLRWVERKIEKRYIAGGERDIFRTYTEKVLQFISGHNDNGHPIWKDVPTEPENTTSS